MCFYYHLSKLTQEAKNRAINSEVLKELDLVNGFTYPQMPVITSSALELMQWGLIPFWSKDDSIKRHTLNARSETVFDKPSFKNSILRKRCLVPANGFFEWQHIGSKKQPFYIHLKNQECFNFAGIWDEWTDKETGEILKTYSILTTVANPLMAKIHNTKKRMPVILTEEVENCWLEDGLSNTDVKKFFHPINEKFIEAYPIKKFKLTEPIQPEIIDRI